MPDIPTIRHCPDPPFRRTCYAFDKESWGNPAQVHDLQEDPRRPGRTTAAEPSRVGKRGTVVIPAALRRRYGIEEGSFSSPSPASVGS